MLGARNQEVARRRQASGLHARARRVLVPCRVDRVGRVAGHAEVLGKPRNKRHRELAEGRDCVNLAVLGTDLQAVGRLGMSACVGATQPRSTPWPPTGPERESPAHSATIHVAGLSA